MRITVDAMPGDLVVATAIPSAHSHHDTGCTARRTPRPVDPCSRVPESVGVSERIAVRATVAVVSTFSHVPQAVPH
jgi:hypothetical protein